MHVFVSMAQQLQALSCERETYDVLDEQALDALFDLGLKEESVVQSSLGLGRQRFAMASLPGSVALDNDLAAKSFEGLEAQEAKLPFNLINLPVMATGESGVSFSTSFAAWLIVLAAFTGIALSTLGGSAEAGASLKNAHSDWVYSQLLSQRAQVGIKAPLAATGQGQAKLTKKPDSSVQEGIKDIEAGSALALAALVGPTAPDVDYKRLDPFEPPADLYPEAVNSSGAPLVPVRVNPLEGVSFVGSIKSNTHLPPVVMLQIQNKQTLETSVKMVRLGQGFNLNGQRVVVSHLQDGHLLELKVAGQLQTLELVPVSDTFAVGPAASSPGSVTPFTGSGASSPQALASLLTDVAPPQEGISR